MYVYLNVYTYIHTYIYIFIQTYKNTYIDIYIHILPISMICLQCAFWRFAVNLCTYVYVEHEPH